MNWIIFVVIVIVLTVMAWLVWLERCKRDRISAQLEREGFVELDVILSHRCLKVRMSPTTPISAQVVNRSSARTLLAVSRLEAIKLCEDLLGRLKAEELKRLLAQSQFFSAADHQYDYDEEWPTTSESNSVKEDI